MPILHEITPYFELSQSTTGNKMMNIPQNGQKCSVTLWGTAFVLQ